MRARLGLAALAGLVLALALAGFRAVAADPTIAADSAADTWNPSTATIHVGETVTWTNDGGFHNVHVAGDSSALVAAGPGWTSVHKTFTQPGTYTFYCEIHGNPDGTGMSGTITVTADATGTSTTPPAGAQPTDTTTVPTTPAADTTAPAFTGRPKRRASRHALVVELSASEPSTLHATVYRRPPRGRAYSRVSESSLRVKQGNNVVALPRKEKSLRSGSYRVTLQLVDAAGNKSAQRALTFKLA